jgi:putative membrane protein
MKRAGVLIVASLFVIGWSSLLWAQEKGEKKMIPDRGFMIYAARDGLFHVEAGKLAVQRASREDVKKFGQHAIEHHSQINDELIKLASTKGVTLPKNMTRKERETLDRLAKLSGADFDKAYIEMEMRDHSKDLSEAQKEAKDGKDPDVKAWAAKIMPTIEEHLKMLRDLSKIRKKIPVKRAGKTGQKNPLFS